MIQVPEDQLNFTNKDYLRAVILFQFGELHAWADEATWIIENSAVTSLDLMTSGMIVVFTICLFIIILTYMVIKPLEQQIKQEVYTSKFHTNPLEL
jgi:hypothetical protein